MPAQVSEALEHTLNCAALRVIAGQFEASLAAAAVLRYFRK